MRDRTDQRGWKVETASMEPRHTKRPPVSPVVCDVDVVNRKGREHVHDTADMEPKETRLPVSPAIRDVDVTNRESREHGHNTADMEPIHTRRPVSPAICETHVVKRKQKRCGLDHQQILGKRSFAQVETKVKVSDKRNLSRSKLKELVKRQKLKHANENGGNKVQSSLIQEDESSVIPEDDQKEIKHLEHIAKMSTVSKDKSLPENDILFDERLVQVCDKKRSDHELDKCTNLKEFEKRQELKPSDAKGNGSSEQHSLFSQEDGGIVIPENNHEEKGQSQGTSGMSLRGGGSPTLKDQNAEILHELANMKVVNRPLRKKSQRRILPNQIAALYMKPDKSKTKRQEDQSEIVDHNGNENKRSAEHGRDEDEENEISGSCNGTLKDDSTVNRSEKITCCEDRKLTEKKDGGTVTEENIEGRLQIEKNVMGGKSEGGVLWRNVDCIVPCCGVNGFKSVGKEHKGSNPRGRNQTCEMNEKDKMLGTSEDVKTDYAVKMKDNVQSVSKLQTGSTSHKRKCPPDTTESYGIEGTNKSLRRKDTVEVDYLHSFCQLTANLKKEKEDGTGRIASGKLVTPAGTGGFTISKLEKGNSVASVTKEFRDKEYTERLKLKLKEIIERSSKGKNLHAQEEKNCNMSQIISGPKSFVGNKDVEHKNLVDNLKGEMKLNSSLPAGKQKSNNCTSVELNTVQNLPPGEDIPDTGTYDISRQCEDEPALPPSKKGDQTDGDDDVILEFIKSPKSVSSQQILVFMNDLFQTQDATKVPPPEVILQKLNKTYGRNMSHWESFVRHHWDLMVASRVGTVSDSVQEKPLATVGKYSLTKTDMDSLENASWLNDNIINSYLHLLTKEAPLQNACFSSFFFQVYLKNGFEHVQRWHRKIDIFACRLILVPIHSRHHWCLVAVDNKDKSIIFYDSMRSGGMRYLMKIKAYMNEEAAARQTAPIEWTLQSKEGIPKQRNTSDCGVFVCQYAKRLCYDQQVTFSHSEATHFRQLMKQELLTKKLQPP